MLQNRFKFNLRFKTVGEVVSRVCALALYAIGARLLGAEGFGLFSLAFSYAMLASVLIDSGTISIVTRTIARDRTAAPALIRTITSYKLLVAPLSVLAVYVAVRYLDPGSQTVSLVRVTGMVAVATALMDHLSSVLSGLERMDIEAWLKTANKVASLVFAVAVFWVDRSVHGFTAGMAIGLWISVGFGFYWVHRNVAPIRFGIDGSLLRRQLRICLPIFLATVLVTFYANQDRYILSYLRFSDRDIGIYSASAKLVDALRPLPILLMGAVYPILSEASVRDRPLFEKIAGALVKYSVLAMFPFAFGITVFSDVVVRLVFGAEFIQTAPILRVAIWGFATIFVNHLFFVFLLSADRQRRFFYSAVVLTVVNFVLCLFFFRWYGPVGGAWALVGGEIAVLVYHLADPGNGWMRRKLASLFFRPGLMAAASVAVFMVARVWLPDPAAWAVAVGAYGTLVWRYSVVDLQLLRRFIV